MPTVPIHLPRYKKKKFIGLGLVLAEVPSFKLPEDEIISTGVTFLNFAKSLNNSHTYIPGVLVAARGIPNITTNTRKFHSKKWRLT